LAGRILEAIVVTPPLKEQVEPYVRLVNKLLIAPLHRIAIASRNLVHRNMRCDEASEKP